MSSKRVGIALKPGAEKKADEWVGSEPPRDTSRNTDQEAALVIKRLTIDVPEDLHRRLKVKAATEGVKMADLVRSWISAHCD